MGTPAIEAEWEKCVRNVRHQNRRRATFRCLETSRFKIEVRPSDLSLGIANAATHDCASSFITKTPELSPCGPSLGDSVTSTSLLIS